MAYVLMNRVGVRRYWRLIPKGHNVDADRNLQAGGRSVMASVPMNRTRALIICTRPQDYMPARA